MTKLDLSRLVPLEDARKLFPIPPSPNTILAWVSSGVNGTKLKAVRIGRRLYTTQEAVEDFVLSQNPTSDAEQGYETGM